MSNLLSGILCLLVIVVVVLGIHWYAYKPDKHDEDN